jgi:uncharacterized protein (DUF1778 family)
LKPDCPNCQAGSCKHLNNQASHFAAFDELITMEPQIFKVSPEEYAWLEKRLAEPPKVNERLRRLLRGKDND